MRTSIVSSLALLVLAGCEITKGGSGSDTARAAGGADTGTAGGVVGGRVDSTMISGDTAPVPGTGPAGPGVDSTALETWPAEPRRGGVVFARLRGTAGGAQPQCTWNRERLPCYAEGDAIVAVVPLPAELAAGSYMLELSGGGRRIGRQITVQEREFGRELVFLDAKAYALTQDAQAIARDGRAVRTVLAGQSAERRWGGRWREPSGAKSTGYGVERFYYRASDSSRAIALGADQRASAGFGDDTSSAARPQGSAPAWRHAGVDLPLRRGTRIEAPAAGLVADVGEYQLTGRTLLIDHGQGVFSAFFHLDTVTARRGDQVRAGQAVARVGSTGLSTGPHLHYGVYVHGRDVDPTLWKDQPSWLGEGQTVRGDTASAGGTSGPAGGSARGARGTRP